MNASRILPYVISVVSILLAIVFGLMWSGDQQRPEREILRDVQVDVMGIVSGATCDRSQESDAIELAVFYYAPSRATFVWQMIVPGDGVVWEQTETTDGELFYSAVGRGVFFTATPQDYDVPDNTPIRIEATAYRGDNTNTRPADFSMIEFDCTTGDVVNSTLTEEIAE